MVGKEHKNLLADIRNYIRNLENGGELKIQPSDFFRESLYQSEQNKNQPCYEVTKKGCEFIAHKLTGQKGALFTAEYINRFHQMESNNNNHLLIETLNNLSSTISTMQQDISNLKKQTTKEVRLPEKRYSRWKTRTFEKLRLLNDYVNENTDKSLTLSNVIHLVIQNTEDTYDIEISDYIDTYKCEFSLTETPYPLDIINNYKDLKDKFNTTLDSILKVLNIREEKVISNNILNELIQKNKITS